MVKLRLFRRTPAFSCGARSAFKLREQCYLRNTLSRRQLQGFVGLRCGRPSAFEGLNDRPNELENIDELLVALFDRLDPNDKAQLLAPILARDLPTAGSGYIYAR
jgi:hypothetical protein